MPLPRLFRTSVFQLTILYVVLFGVSVAALGWFVYQSTVGYLQDQTDEVIEAEIAYLAEQYRQRGFSWLTDVINQRGLIDDTTNDPDITDDPEERFAYLLINRNYRFLAGNIDAWPAPPDMLNGWVEFTTGNRETSPEQDPVLVRARILSIPSSEQPVYRILVGREIRELERIKQTFRRASMLGLGLTMCLAIAGGLALAWSAQRHVAQLNRTTRQIIAGDLSQRVPVQGVHDEHAELAQSVNTMLDQIEHLMAGLRHVGDSIAHDLRGPLTRLRTRLEGLATEDPPSRASVDECLAQADGLLATFNALLRISRIETGAYRQAFETIDLGAIANDVADLYQATADDNRVELRRQVIDQAFVYGDRELLAQALTNLLDNAMKYTPAGGRIDIDVRRKAGLIVASIGDSGPGIPAEARERVLQRFARLDESRSKPGNGLGLALVRAVCDQHDGTMVLTDNGPGLRVTISLAAKPH